MTTLAATTTLAAARVQHHPGRFATVSGLPALGAALALSAMLPPGPRDLAALCAIIVLGIPHGALDGELARARLRPRFPRSWFLVFAAPYLALSALVLAGWSLAPLIVLPLFLAASVWHFGTEEVATEKRGGFDPLVVIGAGGLPVALAVLAHPAATAAIFGTVAQVPMAAPPAWLAAFAWAWMVPAGCWLARMVQARDRTALARAGILAAAGVALPPLTSFAIYFVCVHAPAHVRSLIAEGRPASRITGAVAAARLAVPVTLLTLLIGAALWRFVPGRIMPAPFTSHLLCLTLRGLAALTLPHMLFEQWLRLTAARPRSLPEARHGGSRRNSGTVAPL